MSFIATIDISTFIWCEQDFNANKNKYIILKNLAPNIYTQIRELNLPVLLRNELYTSIMDEFPYKMVKEIGYDFQKLTLEFLTDTFSNWILYTDNSDNSITSNPAIIKPHFSGSIQAETQSQIGHLFHNNQNPEHKFLAYNYFYAQNSNLVVNRQNNDVVIDTLRYNSEEEIIKFFEDYKLRFEHNSKHTRKLRYSSDGEKISPFTCFHQPNGTEKAEKLFKEATLHDGKYFNFDLENNVYVRFLKTYVDRPVYHGHDLSDENQDVPDKVRKKINKNGRVF
ncbi:hypothetical protein FNO01nite_33110 [Flavobacterium noncentrifugens]|uniref:Uncharacterized protein n=1 Tax=Flavobacterium noncentrifugens TaxID=1128970 RepID=A0A1G8ZJS7_9FLAO|nr:hypothetical protein [Flavobacterium noncentrifugens]GEP52639.1 hypothetical protein FNO01nite_33110 [Flavobacterium noncentrifugens]SDK15291.1 hypothetical protein SAMN04487935_2629 [Flavobacterium noncentrifugens]